MADEQTSAPQFFPKDAAEFSQNLAKVMAQSQKALAELMARQAQSPAPDPTSIASPFAEITLRMLSNPQQALEAQMRLWQNYTEAWQSLASPAKPAEGKDAPKPRRDKRFADPAWDEQPVFNILKESYLRASDWLQSEIRQIEGVDEATRQKVEFYTRQFIEAVSPSNFVLTNPQVLRETFETNGENLVKGVDNLLADLEASKGELMVKMTDTDAFEVGKNIAVTPGKVVFQNDIIQLIQYDPTTETVFKKPLLIVPPWINKFYILDLRPENSFIRWSVEQGYTVFVISWVNPDEKLAEKTFEDYVFEGPLAAVDAIEKATGEREVSAIGYCIGGTLMAAALAYLAAVNDTRITNCTFFTTQVDFTEAGELTLFTDEDQLRYLETRMKQHGGILDGAAMANTFNLLRANDLIWSFVVNNYLMGKQPVPFDLLYWNSDATRMPGKLHSYYLRNMYQNNLLAQPGALSIHEVPIDLGKIRIPVYIQAGKEDHIAPARSVYKATKLLDCPLRFMLAGSGHIAGVVNAPSAKKYQHWTREGKVTAATVDEWLAGATETPGSWWPDWHAWLSPMSGEQVPARVPGEGGLQAIEDAPGSYVLVKS
ncbi:MAG TPA: class I poly(R)-hydroxyalkanoic acid synthase [Dehalococcoidia bacterium]